MVVITQQLVAVESRVAEDENRLRGAARVQAENQVATPAVDVEHVAGRRVLHEEVRRLDGEVAGHQLAIDALHQARYAGGGHDREDESDHEDIEGEGHRRGLRHAPGPAERDALPCLLGVVGQRRTLTSMKNDRLRTECRARPRPTNSRRNCRGSMRRASASPPMIRKIMASNAQIWDIWKFGENHSTIRRCCSGLPPVWKG